MIPPLDHLDHLEINQYLKRNDAIFECLEEIKRKALENIDEEFKEKESPCENWFLPQLKDSIVKIEEYDDTSAFICPVKPRTYFQLKKVIFTLELLSVDKIRGSLFHNTEYKTVTKKAEKIVGENKYKVPDCLFVRVLSRMEGGYINTTLYYSTPEFELNEIQDGIEHLENNKKIIQDKLEKIKEQ